MPRKVRWFHGFPVDEVLTVFAQAVNDLIDSPASSRCARVRTTAASSSLMVRGKVLYPNRRLPPWFASPASAA
jgi:hypothetical protein